MVDSFATFSFDLQSTLRLHVFRSLKVWFSLMLLPYSACANKFRDSSRSHHSYLSVQMRDTCHFYLSTLSDNRDCCRLRDCQFLIDKMPSGNVTVTSGRNGLLPRLSLQSLFSCGRRLMSHDTLVKATKTKIFLHFQTGRKLPLVGRN
ncbi:hypothetical protein NPIL_187421 [Nephila pilipes]|uniref:Uncharacterized protein n=1 Tax=Nephila pilipes TaxID=299642 RepID=A0A8X6TGF9_NEPPI|nr:hypothetical protein NPIL_187421 [Nephila pilipes]